MEESLFPPHRNESVIIVDDEPMVGDVVLAILRMGGFCKTIFFENPMEAYERIIHSNPPIDLIITDFLMPQMTGRELIVRVRLAYPNLKTILYSGNVQEEDAYEKRLRPRDKPNRFLRKPFTPKTLLDLVHTVFSEPPTRYRLKKALRIRSKRKTGRKSQPSQSMISS